MLKRNRKRLTKQPLPYPCHKGLGCRDDDCRKAIRIWPQPKKRIVELVTDGVTVMEKTGRLPEVLHQICHSHDIYLAVVNVLSHG